MPDIRHGHVKRKEQNLMRDLIPYELEYLFSYAADCDPNFEVYDPSIFGGFRLTGYIVGGWVKGDKINGKLKPFGGDWCHGTPNGTQNVNVRATIETDDGAKIYMPYQGRNDIGGYEDVLKYKKFIFPEQVRNPLSARDRRSALRMAQPYLLHRLRCR